MKFTKRYLLKLHSSNDDLWSSHTRADNAFVYDDRMTQNMDPRPTSFSLSVYHVVKKRKAPMVFNAMKSPREINLRLLLI